MNRELLLYVENISPSSSEEHLLTYLEKFAPVQQVYFLREKQCTKRSIAGFVRVTKEADLDVLMMRNQQNYRGKRLFMVRADQDQFFQADHTVIVRNITAKISEENLFDHFEECGKIAFLQIRTDDFAYIGFEDKSSVKNAMNKNNKPLKGSNLKIQLLSRNIEIMIVNLGTLQARMPDLYRKMILPVEPRQAGAGQQQQQQKPPQQQQSQQQQPQQQQQQPQQQGNQQQQSQPAKQQPQQQQFRNQQQQQQRPGNQQQQNQRQQQPQQQGANPLLPRPQQPQPQRQQQQSQPQQQQQKSAIQLLKEKANAFAGKQQQQSQQQPQQKPPQQAPVQVQQPKPVETPEDDDDDDDVRIIEPMETTEIIDESDTEIQIVGETSATPAPAPAASDDPSVPPIPSRYEPQPNDVMQPVKASQIPMKVTEVKNEKDNRAVWVNHIPPETRRLALVLYMEQFGDVEACKLGSSTNCYFTRWAKVTFLSEESAKRATEYFLHPFKGHYLFVLACNRYIDEVPGKVFVLDYLSKYLIYEDVAKAFKHVGNVFYLVRLMDNSFKVRIFFLEKVDAAAAVAVKSIDGKPINVEPYTEGMNLKLPKEQMLQLKNERERLDFAKEKRMEKILDIFKDEALDRLDPVLNPDGKSEGNEVVMTNIPTSTTRHQLLEFLKPFGVPSFIRREKQVYNDGCDRVFVGFRTLSMVLKATEQSVNSTLNGHKPFVFPAWTKPHMAPKNTIRLYFDTKDIAVQDIYNGLIHFGRIRYVDKDRTKSALIVFDGHDHGRDRAKIAGGSTIGPVTIVKKAMWKGVMDKNEKKRGLFNNECKWICKRRGTDSATKEEIIMMRKVFTHNEEEVIQMKRLIRAFSAALCEDRKKDNIPAFDDITDVYVARTEPDQSEPEESIVIDDEDDVVEVSNDSPSKTTQPNQKNQQNRQQQQQQQQQRQQQQQQRQQQPQQQQRREPHQQRQQQQNQQRFGGDRNRNQFSDNGFQQQRQQQQPYHQGQRRPMNPWDGPGNQGPMWNDQQQQQQQFRQQFGPDDRFNRNNDGPFNRFGGQDNRNMNPFDQMMMAQQFGNFSLNQQQNDNGGFQHGPLDSDDPPLNRGNWGQQQFNRFNPQQQQQYQQSSFDRGFCDDDDLDFGRDSPGVPSNIPDDQIDEYIMRKQEAIKRRLEQLDKQLITSVESHRQPDYRQGGPRQRQGTVFSDDGDVHYVPNPAAVARNRGRGGPGGGRGRGGPSGRGGQRQNQERQGRRERDELVAHRKRDPFADVDIVPIIRISEERSPSPKRNREEGFDPAQFDAAWS